MCTPVETVLNIVLRSSVKNEGIGPVWNEMWDVKEVLENATLCIQVKDTDGGSHGSFKIHPIAHGYHTGKLTGNLRIRTGDFFLYVSL